MTRTTIDVNLHDTSVRSEARRVCAGKLPEYVAVLKWDNHELELFGSLDDIDAVLDSLQHDLACLRSQLETEKAGAA